MGLAMVAGNFAYGPLDRWLGTRKWVIFGGNALTLACLAGAVGCSPTAPPAGGDGAAGRGVGFFGATFPMVIAHGRAFFPPHLMGRGVTLLNLFGIAPIGLAQIVTGRHPCGDRRRDPAARPIRRCSCSLPSPRPSDWLSICCHKTAPTEPRARIRFPPAPVMR